MIINRNNYEDYFLHYIDRELNGDEQQMVEDFIRQHPDLEKELTALQQTIAIPPVMVFKNKDSLLREEKKRRLYPIYWVRIAAAFIILLAGAWLLLLTTGKIGKNDDSTAHSGEIAVNQTVGKPGKKSPATAINNASGTKVNPGSENTANPKTGYTQNAASTKTVNKESGNQHSAKQVETVHTTDALSGSSLKKTGSQALVRNAKSDALLTESNSPGQHKLNPEEITKHARMNELTDRTESANQNLPKTTVDLPAISLNNQVPETALPVSNPSTINHQLSTTTPASIKESQPDNTISILVFNNTSKVVSGFYKKRTIRSNEDATADNHQRKVRVAVFQFNLKK